MMSSWIAQPGAWRASAWPALAALFGSPAAAARGPRRTTPSSFPSRTPNVARRAIATGGALRPGATDGHRGSDRLDPRCRPRPRPRAGARSRGKVTFKGSRAQPKELAPKGKAAKDPTVCARTRRSCPNGWSSTRPRRGSRTSSSTSPADGGQRGSQAKAVAARSSSTRRSASSSRTCWRS